MLRRCPVVPSIERDVSSISKCCLWNENELRMWGVEGGIGEEGT